MGSCHSSKLPKFSGTPKEFECGVTSGNGGTDKQEWSFTLYDFDGRGKVTKEDLATLMKSLYEVVGSSLKLQGQQRGNANKSFKLRLTMAPESASGSACDGETPTSSCCADQVPTAGSQTNDSAVHLHHLQQQSASAVHPGRKKRQQHDDFNRQRKRCTPPAGGSLPLLQASDTGSTPSPQGAASAQQAPSSRSTRSRGERRMRETSSRSSTRPHSSRHSHTRSSIDPSPETEAYHYPAATTTTTAAVLPRPPTTGGLITTAATVEHSPSERYRHVIRNAAVDYPLRHFNTDVHPPSPRHAKRQSHRRNRDLAMQHVAEWLQREPLQVWTGGREGPCGAEDNGPSPDDIPPRVVIHEHRHVHEHHHHYYYHHYHDT